MMATKQAMVAGDHVDGLDATIFYMDIRAFGKDFDQYYERAKATEKHTLHQEHSVACNSDCPAAMTFGLNYYDENNEYSAQGF